ncbi:MAG: D-alanine--D-alanine ligase family protein [Catonella sp.]
MKKRVVVIVGGRSSEHEVSLVSGATVIENIDAEKYDVKIVVISKDGEWLLAKDLETLKSGAWKESRIKAAISPDTKDKALLIFNEDGSVEKLAVDVAYPVLHGLYGEDGTIQGIFEMAGIPYVGCGVIASAVGMDKWYTKQVVYGTGIRQARFVPVYRDELKEMNTVLDRIEKAYPYPYFVKPSNAGSSKGVSKAADREGLRKALLLAAEHDRKILVEETIVGRELECAVLGDYNVKASGVGEILAAAEFYDFDAKYNNAESKTVISPLLPEGKTEEIREAAVKIFKALDGYGLSRVDFFLENGTNEIVFNEINTLPGFTAISMYPMLWEAQGIDKKSLVEELINLALRRYKS